MDKELHYAVCALIGYIEGGFGGNSGPLAHGLIERANEVARLAHIEEVKVRASNPLDKETLQ